MPALRPGLILAAGLVILSPLDLLGHGMEFLTAKLTLLPGAEVQLEVTVDYANNPLVPDETAALEALSNPLRLKLGETWAGLSEMSAPTWQRHGNWSECAPPNLLPPPEETTHALLTAKWRWRHPENTLVLTVPKGNMHDVFLWQEEAAEETASSSPKWMLLLGGDETRPLAVTPRRPWWPWTGLIPALGLAALCWRRQRRTSMLIESKA